MTTPIHWIQQCYHCNKLMAQCSCPEVNKAVFRGNLCPECRAATLVEDDKWCKEGKMVPDPLPIHTRINENTENIKKIMEHLSMKAED